MQLWSLNWQKIITFLQIYRVSVWNLMILYCLYGEYSLIYHQILYLCHIVRNNCHTAYIIHNILKSAPGLQAYCALGIPSLPAELQVTFLLCNTAVFVFSAAHGHVNTSQQQWPGRLAVMTTVSSSLNLGMYLSPLVISASFRGLKRHITLTPHSDASIMAAAGTVYTAPPNNAGTNK